MKIVEVNLLKESTYQTPCGIIHYWSSILSLDTTTLVFLPGLTAGHNSNTDKPEMINSLIEEFLSNISWQAKQS